MKFKVGNEDASAEVKLAADYPDNSGIGVHYIDQYLKPLNAKADDFEVKAKRRGLKISLKINGTVGSGLMRRLDISEDPKIMLQAALKEAAKNAGYKYTLEERAFFFEPLQVT